MLGEIGEAADGQQDDARGGQLTGFAACYGRVADGRGRQRSTLDAESAKLLGLAPGDSFLAIGR